MKKVITKINLKYGMEGNQIAEAQKLLQKAGSAIQVNGKYTIGMVTAVRAFQKKNGLKVTGIIDDETWVKLNEKKPAKKPVAKKK